MNPLTYLYHKVADEPAVTLAVLVGAVNAVTVQTWQGYASAVAVGLLRFLVTPATKQA